MDTISSAHALAHHLSEARIKNKKGMKKDKRKMVKSKNQVNCKQNNEKKKKVCGVIFLEQ